MQQKPVRIELVFNRKNKWNEEGKALLQIRAYLNGKSRFFSTNIYLTPKEWNAKKMQPQNFSICEQVNQQLSELRNFATNYRARYGRFDLVDFDQMRQTTPQVAVPVASFTDFFKTQLDGEKILNQPSWRMRCLTLKVFQEFRKDVLFTDFNHELIRGFERFLQNKNLHKNTIHKHFKHLKKYAKLAVVFKRIDYADNPFISFGVKQGETNAQSLMANEVKALEDLVFTPEQPLMEKARDMFLFSCYTGLRFGDALKLKPKDFATTADGLVFVFKAQKTGKADQKTLGIRYEGKPETIALKYISDDRERPLFKGLTNPKVNKFLKELASMANITNTLRFKDSRNTFAKDLENRGASISTIAKELQHAKLGTTQIYLKTNELQHEKNLNELWKR